MFQRMANCQGVSLVHDQSLYVCRVNAQQHHIGILCHLSLCHQLTFSAILSKPCSKNCLIFKCPCECHSDTYLVLDQTDVLSFTQRVFWLKLFGIGPCLRPQNYTPEKHCPAKPTISPKEKEKKHVQCVFSRKISVVNRILIMCNREKRLWNCIFMPGEIGVSLRYAHSKRPATGLSWMTLLETDGHLTAITCSDVNLT